MPATPRRAATSPALQAFGRQLVRYRQQAGVKAAAIARRTKVTPSFVSQVEKGKKRCSREFVEAYDAMTRASGALIALYQDLTSDQALAFPTWFDWPTIESEAIMLVSWQPMVVHGLLQHEEYATAVLRGDEEKIQARMTRQAILTRDEPAPPRFTLLLEEGALHREVGSPAIMRTQLRHLVSLISDRLSVQVVASRGEHDGNAGSVTLATLDDMTQLAYVETVARGFTLGEAEELANVHAALEEVRALAYPVGESIEIINRVVDTRWT